MKDEKFVNDAQTVLKFIQLHCDEKHECEKEKGDLDILYKDKNLLHVNFELCPICKDIFFYSLNKLQHCPHEDKPKCRKCDFPCYERKQWKQLAKIMRYSGMRLGLLKAKNLFKKS